MSDKLIDLGFIIWFTALLCTGFAGAVIAFIYLHWIIGIGMFVFMCGTAFIYIGSIMDMDLLKRSATVRPEPRQNDRRMR